MQILKSTEIHFERPDWKLFTSPTTLAQKAGVEKRDIPALVIKELVDNALDASGACDFGPLGEDGFFVENEGTGLPKSLEDIADLFSLDRPLKSTKFYRMPTRGALGNGIRVVVGAITASRGSLILKTHGKEFHLIPQENGKTKVEKTGVWTGTGTRIEVSLPRVFDEDEIDRFKWVSLANILAKNDTLHKVKSSPWWYDSQSFLALLHAAGKRTVRDVISRMEGCTGGKAGEIAKSFKNRKAEALTLAESNTLLVAMRENSDPVKPKRLGGVGKTGIPGMTAYACIEGAFTEEAPHGGWHATIPYRVEAWAGPPNEACPTPVLFHINRSSIPDDITMEKAQTKNHTRINVGSLMLLCPTGTDYQDYSIRVNIQTPYIPFTSDSKRPDLTHLAPSIIDAITKAVKRAKASRPRPTGGTKSEPMTIILRKVINEAIDKASGGFDEATGRTKYRYSLRQLFYVVRPLMQNFTEEVLIYQNFSQMITDYEAEQQRDLPGIYRDNRGILYHPHTGETIPMGTLAVEAYKRPSWSFNKILFCEKEGFFPLLQDVRWPERHDCALITGKGYSSRAVRDVLDLIGNTDEPVTIFCIHDADGDGTVIFETLQNATKARRARTIQVVNLGLDPTEAREMELEVEKVTAANGRSIRTASYVPDEDKEWLQHNRVELNAMDSPTFLRWLDGKVKAYEKAHPKDPSNGKVVPPPDILSEHLERSVRQNLTEQIQAKILQEARFNERVNTAFTSLTPAIQSHSATLPKQVATALKKEPANQWLVPVKHLAQALVKKSASRKHPPSLLQKSKRNPRSL